MAGIFIKWPRLSGVPRDASKDAGRQSHPESDSERAGRQIGQQLEVALPLHGGMLRSSAAASHQNTARHPYLPSKSMPSESLAFLEKPGSIG
jgi:hypothetical protein